MTMKSFFLWGLVSVLCAGCATIFNWDNRGAISLWSSQPDTVVEVYNRGKLIDTVTTPFTYNVRSSAGYFKKAAYEFKFSKAGYEPVSEIRCARFSAWYWWNILLGGAVGMLIVDPLTGSMYWIDDSPIQVDLYQKK